MKFKLLFLILIFSFSKILATGQAPDKIIIENKEYDLLNNPLERFFENNPDFDPIYGGKLKMFETYKKAIIPIPFTTGNYRGYIATFKIENSFLKLTDIKIQNIDSEEHEYISVFKELFGDKKIDLDYSGILIIPIGKFIDSANFGYSSLFDKYRLITIKKNFAVKEKDLDADDFIKFKNEQFKIYIKTEGYKIEVKNYLKSWLVEKKWDLSKKNIKNLSKDEIEELKKNYQNQPDENQIDDFLFLTKNIDFIIDY